MSPSVEKQIDLRLLNSETLDARSAIESVIGVLEHYRSRPTMLTVSAEWSVDRWLLFQCSFNLACNAIGISYGIEIEREILHRHGWERTADCSVEPMREAGLNDEAIVREMYEMEIEKWQCLLGSLPSTA